MPTIIRKGTTTCFALAMAVAAGCSDSTGPDRTNVTGGWSGSTVGMSLSVGVTEEDGRFSGFGNFSDRFGSIPVTVHGGRNGKSIAMTLRADGYEAAAFTGTLVDSVTIRGALNRSGFENDSITLYKRRG
jgi:hypothetical protein